MNEIYSMQTYSITITAGTGGQIQVFKNGADLGYFRGTKIITANAGDAISVWCDADTGYVFTNLCTPDGTCTSARPFNFTANMNISMTATFTPAQQCTQQDNSFLINGKSGSIVVAPGQVLNATVRSTTADCLGIKPGWKIIAISGSPLGFGDIRVDTGDHSFGADGCGSTSFILNVIGTYTLVCRWCCIWTGNEHCGIGGDIDLPNTIKVTVQNTPAPGTGGCDPTTCPSTKNLCIAGTCVPKSYVFIGAAAIVGFMLLSRGD